MAFRGIHGGFEHKSKGLCVIHVKIDGIMALQSSRSARGMVLRCALSQPKDMHGLRGSNPVLDHVRWTEVYSMLDIQALPPRFFGMT
jgi:hypothetical protein